MDTPNKPVETLTWRLDIDGSERHSLNDLIDSIPILMAYVSSDMIYQFVNKTFESWFCIPRREVVGQRFGSFLPKDVEDLDTTWKEVLAGNSQSFRKFVQFPDGRKRWIKCHAVTRFSPEGEPVGFFISCEDQTNYVARKRILDERETELRTILDNIVEGVIVSDEFGIIEVFSRGAEAMFGYRQTDLLGKNLKTIMPNAVARKHDQYLVNYRKTGRGRIIGVGGRELEGLRKDGSVFPIELVIGEFDTGQGRRYIGCIRDITLRKETLRSLRAVSSRLINAMEVERRRIALELHDDLSQQLALLSVELDLLTADLPTSREGILAKLSELQIKARQTTSAIHKMSHGLHPAMLEQLGLAAAVKSYCREVSSRSAVQVHFECKKDLPKFDPSTSLCIYRVVQEAVQNVLKHSGASEAHIRLEVEGSLFCLRVVDGGLGFDHQLDSSNGLGLISMRERMNQIGGTLELKSQKGHGTTVIATIDTQ